MSNRKTRWIILYFIKIKKILCFHTPRKEFVTELVARLFDCHLITSSETVVTTRAKNWRTGASDNSDRHDTLDYETENGQMDGKDSLTQSHTLDPPKTQAKSAHKPLRSKCK